MKRYITYEEPFEDREFTFEQAKDIYRDMVNKEEYPSFYCWFADMLKSGVFEEVKS